MMIILSERIGNKLLSMVITLLSLFVLTLPPVSAAVNVTTKIKHKPIKYFMTEKRIQLQVDVKDTKGIQLVRCYFKAEAVADFVFVPMTQKKEKTFEGILPAPSAMTQSIDYLFLVVNNDNQVVKTQIFTATKNKDSRFVGTNAFDGEIRVFSEIESASAPGGFSDSIVMDVVESSARFGIVAGGLYTQGAGASVAAASLTSSGGAAAGTGLSTTAIVVGGVALAGGVAAMASSSGGGGEGVSDATITGDWSGSWTGEEGSGEWEMTVLVDNSFSLVKNDSGYLETFTGVWEVNGNHMTATLERNGTSKGTISADVSGDSLSGTVMLDDGMSYTWSGSKQEYGSIDLGW